jgi:hypothetical protein
MANTDNDGAGSSGDIAPIPELEAAIAADAHLMDDAAAGGAPGGDGGTGDEPERQVEPTRDERGRFRSAEEEAARASQEQAKAGQDKPAGSTAEKTAADSKTNNTETDPKADNNSGKPQSAFARENERKAKTWEAINQQKEELRREREQIELEKAQVQAIQAQGQQARRDEHGFTANDYATRAGQWTARAQELTQQAMAAEARGDFTESDRLNAAAAGEAALAKKAQARAATLKGGGVADVWSSLGADLPEAMQYDSEVNKQLRATLRANAELLGHPMGPYRAAVRVGRELLTRQGAELAKAQAEAGKVKGLETQVSDLTRQLAELRQKTSLSGGRANLIRGDGGERKFDDLSIEEMERELLAQT